MLAILKKIMSQSNPCSNVRRIVSAFFGQKYIVDCVRQVGLLSTALVDS